MKRLAPGLGPRWIQVVFVVLVLILWHYMGVNKLVNPIFLPPLDQVVEEFNRLILSGEAVPHLLTTLSELAVAYSLSTVLGLTLGFAVARSRYATATFEPLFSGIFAIPLVIFLPLYVLLFGLGSESKMAFGATLAFFPIVLNTIGGITQVDQRFIAVAKSLGATDFQLFTRVLLPAALPVIVMGVRIGFIIAFLGIIGCEMIASYAGLGNQIVRFAEGMRTPQMFSYVVLVILIATALNWALNRIQLLFGSPTSGA
jgi:ABC-type nitrate/sulfonate/bicarbonate transport system permease component